MINNLLLISYALYPNMSMYGFLSPTLSLREGVCGEIVVENKGFEPLTPCVQGRCSSQLS